MAALIVIAGMIALAAAFWLLLLLLLLLCHFLNLSETLTDKSQIREFDDEKLKVAIALASCSFNSNDFDALEWRKPVLGKIMEALADPNTHSIGVCGSQDHIKDTVLQRVYRRVQRDQLFCMVVTVTVTKHPDVSKIQEDIASQLGFGFKSKSRDKRANELIQRIKNEENILVVLRNLCKRLDLIKVGIPYDHNGCKILITSTTEDVISKHMHAHITFRV